MVSASDFRSEDPRVVGSRPGWSLHCFVVSLDKMDGLASHSGRVATLLHAVASYYRNQAMLRPCGPLN